LHREIQNALGLHSGATMLRNGRLQAQDKIWSQNLVIYPNKALAAREEQLGRASASPNLYYR
jgi:hypothetical protein